MQIFRDYQGIAAGRDLQIDGVPGHRLAWRTTLDRVSRLKLEKCRILHINPGDRWLPYQLEAIKPIIGDLFEVVMSPIKQETATSRRVREVVRIPDEREIGKANASQNPSVPEQAPAPTPESLEEVYDRVSAEIVKRMRSEMSRALPIRPLKTQFSGEGSFLLGTIPARAMPIRVIVRFFKSSSSGVFSIGDREDPEAFVPTEVFDVSESAETQIVIEVGDASEDEREVLAVLTGVDPESKGVAIVEYLLP